MSTVSGVHLLDTVGARPAVRQQDFSQGVRLIVSQQLPIPPDAEGNAGHGLMAQVVVLDNLQAGQGLVLQAVGDAVPCYHSGGSRSGDHAANPLGRTVPGFRMPPGFSSVKV